MTDTRQALPPLPEAAHNPRGWSYTAEQMQAYARAALAAQPVAGAVATDETGWLIEHSGEILPGAEQRAQVSWLRVQMKFNGYGAREFGFTHDANEALRFARKEDAEAVLAMHLGASPPDWYSKPFSVTEHMWPLVPQAQAAPAPEPSRSQKMREAGFTARDTRLTCDECGAKFTRQFAPLHECAAPEPSAQAVMTELEQRLIEIAKALPPMTTLGWNDGGMCEPDEAIKGYTKKQVLEILAQHLSASPQPEPSAQGEPAATVTDEMVTAYLTANDAYWRRIDGEPTVIGKWRGHGTPSEATRVSLMAALASAPSTPPPEVVEAVPLEIDYDALITAAFKLHRYRQGTGACIAFKRGAEWMRDQVGIAPKAAQP